MVAKLCGAHPHLGAALMWAETVTEPITEEVEATMSTPGVDVERLSWTRDEKRGTL